MQDLGSLKPFLWYAPHLSGARIPCFHILSFLRAHHRERRVRCIVMVARWQVFVPSWVSSGLTSSHWRAAGQQLLRTVLSPFYWYSRKKCHFSPLLLKSSPYALQFILQSINTHCPVLYSLTGSSLRQEENLSLLILWVRKKGNTE